MEDLGPVHCDSIGIAVKKKRTQATRRPKSDTHSNAGSQDIFLLSTSLPSDDAGSGAESAMIRTRNREDKGFEALYNNDRGRIAFKSKRSTEGVLASTNWKSSKVESAYGGSNGEIRSSRQSRVIFDAQGSDNQVRKVKLKVGGVMHTIGTKSTFSMPQSSDTLRSNEKLNIQVNFKKNHFGSDKRSGLQGIPWRDFSRSDFTLGKEDSSMVGNSGKNTSAKQGDNTGPMHKSKRVAKKYDFDGEFGEDYVDDEIRYLEKLRAPKMAPGGYNKEDSESRQKQQNLSSVGKAGTLKIVKEGKNSRLDRSLEDGDYEEELASDAEVEGSQKKWKESVDSPTEGKREMTLITRQRALQLSKDGSSVSSSIEFPNGLPPAPSRKQKEKLSEMEQQIKKAEAAERRKLQNERAARESEAEAIRKILGQDSSRKKREDKIKKRQEELAQEKAANALLGSNTVRWVMGPTGTVVTFPKDMGLPSIFDSKPASYPPPREKCAGPSCTNPYRYRDSKSKLPLCSLRCYKAVQEQKQPETG